MTAATFTGTGRGKADPEEQFRDALGEDTEEEFPSLLEDAKQPPNAHDLVSDLRPVSVTVTWYMP